MCDTFTKVIGACGPEGQVRLEYRENHKKENYLLFSDVHLGADLIQHAAPWTTARLKKAARIDRDLSSMLEHYRTSGDPNRPWCLVIAGDLVDFIGMSIAPASETETALNDEERENGLGSAHDHAVQKMRAVARRHVQVFDRLASFIADGHRLVLVRGNHDVDFHWEQAQRAFVEAIVEKADGVATSEDREIFAARIEFSPWFYYVEGLLYVEHGHQYDPTCSYEHQLVPVSPKDSRRINWSFSDVLLRSVVRPTRGLGSEGHDAATFMTYMRLAASMGIGGGVALAKRYISAIAQLIRISHLNFSQQARTVREEQEKRMLEMANRARLGVDKVRAIARLAAPPIGREVMGILRGLFVDKMAMVLGGLVAIALVMLLDLPRIASWSVGALTVIAVGLMYQHSTRARAQVFKYGESLRRIAGNIAELVPARFVVMGHTHEAIMARVAANTTYVNLGAWAVDELAEEASTKSAACTHLVIRHDETKKPQAEFFT
ncbi:MAG: metallophosphoesterase [Sandaracinaceae bacterium]|nr:metallophosphoesterase [Sandaracinaceae bacterium]